jgi:hypothetical protein
VILEKLRDPDQGKPKSEKSRSQMLNFHAKAFFYIVTSAEFLHQFEWYVTEERNWPATVAIHTRQSTRLSINEKKFAKKSRKLSINEGKIRSAKNSYYFGIRSAKNSYYFGS